MATLNDFFRVAGSLPSTVLDKSRPVASVMNRGKAKNIAWVWLERVHPKKARVPNQSVLAVRVRDLGEKERLLATNPGVLFTEPHYDGYPAVLVRLDAIETDRLELLITEAWRCQAPPALVEEFDA